MNMGKIEFTKPVDAVLMTVLVLKRLNAFSLTNLADRIRCQKLQYLAQVFKVSPAYNFNLYLRGPYSPDLTKDLFEAKEHIKLLQNIQFASQEMEERFLKLKKFVDSKELRQLELIATYHWLINEAKLSEDSAVKKMKEIKTSADEEVRFVQNSIKEVPA